MRPWPHEDVSAAGVTQRQCGAGKIDKQFFSCSVDLAHRASARLFNVHPSTVLRLLQCSKILYPCFTFHCALNPNLTVDWSERERVRAKLRLMLKRILRKYKYPPDLQDAAVELVLQQAQALGVA